MEHPLPTSAIDYSMLPPSSKPTSVAHNIFTAITITLGILIVMGLGAAFTSFIGHRDGIMAIIAGIGVALIWLVTIYAWVLRHRKLIKQRLVMEQFASTNGWQFNGQRFSATAPDIIPTSLSLNPSQSIIRFVVSGQVNGHKFDLFYLNGFAIHSSATRIVSLRMQGWAHVTILRLNGTLQLQAPESIMIIHENNYTYVIMDGNVLSKTDMASMFNAVLNSL